MAFAHFSFSSAALFFLSFGSWMIIPTWFTGFKQASCKGRIEEWVKHKGYKAVRLEYKYLRRGPFRWSSPAYQPLFRAEVLNQNNEKETYWFLFGSWTLGLFSACMKVHKAD